MDSSGKVGTPTTKKKKGEGFQLDKVISDIQQALIYLVYFLIASTIIKTVVALYL